MGALNCNKGALVGIADGECGYQLSPEFTLSRSLVTLSTIDKNCPVFNGPHALRANKP